MTTLPDLGPLAFTAEDLINSTRRRHPEVYPMEWPTPIERESIQAAADDLNRILAEKLAKAPEVFGCKGGDGKYYMDEREDRKTEPAYTHSARLVCIEEIKK